MARARKIEIPNGQHAQMFIEGRHLEVSGKQRIETVDPGRAVRSMDQIFECMK